MEMAEKDETEGRCPACRTPYDKDRIVGTAANCKRLNFLTNFFFFFFWVCITLTSLALLNLNRELGDCSLELLCWTVFYWIICLSRLVAEINMEKKQKSQKAKIKTAESRKPLSSVRVIQRNLVYIVGLPLNLGDEDVRASVISTSLSLVCVLITCIGFLCSFCNEKSILLSMARS